MAMGLEKRRMFLRMVYGIKPWTFCIWAKSSVELSSATKRWYITAAILQLVTFLVRRGTLSWPIRQLFGIPDAAPRDFPSLGSPQTTLSSPLRSALWQEKYTISDEISL